MYLPLNSRKTTTIWQIVTHMSRYIWNCGSLWFTTLDFLDFPLWPLITVSSYHPLDFQLPLLSSSIDCHLPALTSPLGFNVILWHILTSSFDSQFSPMTSTLKFQLPLFLSLSTTLSSFFDFFPRLSTLTFHLFLWHNNILLRSLKSTFNVPSSSLPHTLNFQPSTLNIFLSPLQLTVNSPFYHPTPSFPSQYLTHTILSP